MAEILAVQQVERYVRERRDTDKPLVSWALYYFLLSWVTFGIYPVIVYYRRMARADLFRDRKRSYYEALLLFTHQYAEVTGGYDSVHGELSDLDESTRRRFSEEHKPINPGLSLLLSIITLGIYGFYVYYRLMRFWWEIQVTEQDFDEGLSRAWTRLHIVKYPVSFQPLQALRRSFGLHLLLSFVTFGIYGIIWDYRMHTDPDRVYPEFHTVEDMVLNVVRTAIPLS